MMGLTVWPESTTMTQQRAKSPTSARSLVWLLLVAVALMGLTVTRQQALGPLHTHADQEVRGNSTLSAVVSSLASDWLSRWRQQQVFGHNQLRLAAVADPAPLLPPGNFRAGAHGAQVIGHDVLERHHHAVDDASVVAVDGAAQAADVADRSAAGAPNLLSIVTTPNGGLVLPALGERCGTWPIDRAATFVSRSIAPPLRPPAA